MFAGSLRRAHVRPRGARLAAVCAAVVSLAAAAGVPAGNASTVRVVGGPAAALNEAPWSVFVVAPAGDCSGSIIGPREVLTAAHCVLTPDQSAPIGAGAVVMVHAGWRFAQPSPQGTLVKFGQSRRVTNLRLPTQYDLSVPPETRAADVAVLTVNADWDFSDPGVGPIALVDPGDRPTGGETARLYGFGLPDTAHLHLLDMTVTPSWMCGPANAVLICGVTPSGTSCGGDSGGGLVSAGPAPQLLGVTSASAGTGAECNAGEATIFARLAAPEIAAFVRGQPGQLAPRLTSAPHIQGNARPGRTVTCTPGAWTQSGTATYVFRQYDTGRDLQRSTSATYVVRPDDVGHQVACFVEMRNAGGTGHARSAEALLGAALKSPQLRLRAKRSGYAYRTALPADARLGFTVRRHGKVVARRSVRVAAQHAGRIPASRLRPGRYTACVTSAPTAEYAAGKVCVRQVVRRHT